MSELDRFSDYLHKSIALTCSMKLLTRDFEPPLAEGAGTVNAAPFQNFEYTMSGLPPDLGHSLRSLNRLRAHPYDVQNQFRLILTDEAGIEWNGGWTIPIVNTEPSSWCFEGTFGSLVTTVSRASPREPGVEVRFTVPLGHQASIILQRFFSETVEVEVLGNPVTLSYREGSRVLIISAPASSAFPPHCAENWLLEPFRILFGQPIFPKLVERRIGSLKSMIWIRSCPSWSRDFQWTALWDGPDALTDRSGFIDLYRGLLAAIASAEGFESHLVTSFYEQLFQASHGSRWGLALSLTSSVEGASKLLVPRDTLRPDADQAAIDSLCEHIETWQGSERVKNRAISATKQADILSVSSALSTLAEKGIGTAVQVKAWNRLRNKIMHGELISEYSSEDQDETILGIADLLKALTRELAIRNLN